jgi:1-deoxy-D-xylulose-5-phosphate reductoisomerase
VRKGIAVLGSTGSIGRNALDVLSRLRSDFEVVALSAGSNVKLLAEQAKAFRPRVVFAENGSGKDILRLIPKGIEVESGRDGIARIVSRPDVDIILLAIAGTACIPAFVKAAQSGKRIALANKEALVSAGPVIMRMVGRSGSEVIPVDSEHSAIFQCLSGSAVKADKIYLTGSGGPLLNVPKTKFASVSVDQILKHPKWKMGRKISVDSATMMNKGLEIIEAQHLFGIDQKRIEVLIHPEAIVHSMVEFSDGAVIAQLGAPDMRIPIQYALTYPYRRAGTVQGVDFAAVSKLTFRRPDLSKFPCLGMARAAARSGGTAPAALCAADEEAVNMYLDKKIRFTEIPKVIEKIMARHKNRSGDGLTIDEVMRAGEWAKEEARSICYH